MDTLEEIKQILKENAIQQAKNDKLFAELRISQAETDAKFKETDAKFKETEKLVKELTKNIGGVSNSNGDFAEEFFYNALEKKKTMGGIKFDVINKNVSFSKKGINGEFDIVMINGDAIALIETKYKVKKTDLENLMTKKPTSFRLLFPEFKDYKFYLGIAGMSFDNKKVEDQAHKAGIAILKQKGDVLLVDDSNLKVY
jgi:hypothetical protein